MTDVEMRDLAMRAAALQAAVQRERDLHPNGVYVRVKRDDLGLVLRQYERLVARVAPLEHKAGNAFTRLPWITQVVILLIVFLFILPALGIHLPAGDCRSGGCAGR